VGKYDFHHADRLVDWALGHNMKVKGHVLVWHVTTPSFVEKMTSSEIREELKRHIFTTMGHFRGRIKIWDVVNEALAPDGTMADNIFLKKLGPGYIEQSFRWAHEADPDSFLIYNDNKVEGLGGANASKSQAFYELLRDLKEKNVPIHGAGMQGHFDAAGVGKRRVPTPSAVKSQIRRIGELGLKVNISELDVRCSKLPLNVQNQAQSQIYHDIVAAALTEPAFDGIWLWGFTDKHTWITQFYHQDQPLIFDENYNRKPSYFALKRALMTLVLKHNSEDNWGKDWMAPEPLFHEKEIKGDSKPDWLQEL